MKNKSIYRQMSEKKTFLGFIKSLCLLLASLIILVISVLAWFKTENKATANGIRVSLEYKDIDVEYEGESEKEIFLPSAAKIGSVDSKNICSDKFTVNYPANGYIKVEISANNRLLHYLVTDSIEQSEWISELNKATDSKRDRSIYYIPLKPNSESEQNNNYKAEFYIIYFGEYIDAASEDTDGYYFFGETGSQGTRSLDYGSIEASFSFSEDIS